MKALTLLNPWAQAIAYWGKDVENRTWAPPASLVGERIAIHAGKLPLTGAAAENAVDPLDGFLEDAIRTDTAKPEEAP